MLKIMADMEAALQLATFCGQFIRKTIQQPQTQPTLAIILLDQVEPA
jgi:hypothetical protein